LDGDGGVPPSAGAPGSAGGVGSELPVPVWPDDVPVPVEPDGVPVSVDDPGAESVGVVGESGWSGVVVVEPPEVCAGGDCAPLVVEAVPVVPPPQAASTRASSGINPTRPVWVMRRSCNQGEK